NEVRIVRRTLFGAESFGQRPTRPYVSATVRRIVRGLERSARTTCPMPKVANRVSIATWRVLAELLGEPDNDALGSADIGEPVRLLVPHFANELGPVGAHARNDSVDVID